MGRPLENPQARFWKYVYKTPNCWFWIGHVGQQGYGVISIGPLFKKAHVFSYELHFGEHTEPCILHRCDIRQCVNPEHLYAGDNKQNMIDSAKAGTKGLNAFKTHCLRGHNLFGDNLRLRSNGTRICLACVKIRNRMRRGGNERPLTFSRCRVGNMDSNSSPKNKEFSNGIL